jgi:hypothetical protein
MFCPNCGQERISVETSFCSRCGFLLTGIAEIMEAGGVVALAQKEKRTSKLWRNRGFKKGLFIFLLTFVVVPILTLIAMGLRAGPILPVVGMILLAGGGLLKMIYALMFETAEPSPPTSVPTIRGNVNRQHQALPPQQSMPVSSYAPPGTGSWRDTNDLQPTSVTETTTRLLENERRS